MLEAAGIDVKVVDVESYATERACQLVAKSLPGEGLGKTIAVIDIGAHVSNFTVLRDLKTLFSREEMFGGERLTSDIQRHYGLSYAEAGLLKKTTDVPDDYHSSVLEPFIEAAVIQIRRSVQFFYSSTQLNEINHIILAGGAVLVPGLVDKIAAQLNIETTIADPFLNMTLGRRLDAEQLSQNAASFMVASGLAMRGFTS